MPAASAPRRPPPTTAKETGGRWISAHRGLVIGATAVLLVGTVVGGLLLGGGRGGGDGDGNGHGTMAADWLPAELTANAVQAIDPLTGGTIRVGAASVQVFPGTFAETVQVTAVLRADGSLEVSAEPPLALALPVRITLPLPPGAEWGDDPSVWPVVIGTGTGEPLVLQPNTVGPEGLSVDVPHFSSFVPTTWEDAVKRLAKLGKALSAPPAPKSPGGVDVGMSLPKDYDTDAAVGQVSINVQATTGGPKPQKPPSGTLPEEWKQFEGLNVLVYGYRRPASNQPAQEVLLANSPLNSGGSARIDITLPGGGLWEEVNAGQAMVVVKLIKGGKTVLEKTVPVPIGGYWGSFKCSEGRDAVRQWNPFTVYYLKSPDQSGYPDNNYQSYQAGPATGYVSRSGFPLSDPARVLDTCSALSEAYTAFNSASYFGDSANAPSDEMEVWLQNWDENYAGNVSNYIVLSVREATAEEFRVNAAHELAHRFQHQYSIGLFGSGGWLHEASAEYLAQRVFLPAGESNQTMVRFFGGNPSWVNNGLFSSAESDNYAAASFLAYLADAYGINIAREVWVEGGSGTSNVSSWASHLDAIVKRHAPAGSLAEAWAGFMNAYLVDAKVWGDWGSVAQWVALTDVTFDAAKASTLFSSKRMPTPLFSAGGVLFRVANTPAATIVTHITASPAQRASESDTSWYAMAPGESADGIVTPITLGFVQGRADYQGSFRLGPDKGALGPGPRARIIHVYRGLAGTGYNWIQYDSWALPRIASVEYDDATGKLTWPKSPVESLADGAKQNLFEEYEVVARRQDNPDEWVVLDTIGGGDDTYEVVIDGARLALEKAGPDVCVRVRDVGGNTSPEGCPDESGELVFRLTSLTSTGDPLVVGHLFGMFTKPAPGPVSTCVDNPTTCYFAVLPVPGASAASGAAVAYFCTDLGLKTARVTPSEAILAGTCIYVGGGARPSEQGIPAMYMTLTANSLKSELGGTYKAGEDSQPNIMNWVVLEAAFPGNAITGKLDLTSYFQFKSDGVWTPDYNPDGPISDTPPRFATVTFEGTRVK